MADIEFVNGLNVKAPRDGAPEFVKAAISIKVADLSVWLHNKMKEGAEWVNVDVKESKGGKWYAAVNTYKPKEGSAPKPTGKPADDIDSDSIPF